MLEPGSQVAYTALLGLLRERIGLDPASVAVGGVPAALASLGIGDGSALAAYVEAARAQPHQLDALVQRIVVHETWFFREPAAFDVLAAHARDTVRAGSGRRYRVLSLPCSTGEEPYSVAMALQGLPLDLVAIDISPAAIERARAGRFGSHAFRGRSAAWQQAHFHFDGQHWRPRQDWSPALRFEVGNLLTLPPWVGEEPFDAVLCRNLLIYLDPAARAQAYATLRRLTRADGGLIFVGHAESAGAFDGALERVDHPMSFAFRNRVARRPAEPAPPLPAPVKPRPAVARPGPAIPRPDLAAPPPRPAPPRAEADPLQAVRMLADRGELQAALQACSALLRARPTLADGHALMGVLAAANGQPDEARAHLSRALYLDPEHRDSLSHLLLLAEQAGDLTQAARLRARLRRMAETA